MLRGEIFYKCDECGKQNSSILVPGHRKRPELAVLIERHLFALESCLSKEGWYFDKEHIVYCPKCALQNACG